MTNSSYLDQLQKIYPMELLNCSNHNISLSDEQTVISEAGHVHIYLNCYSSQDLHIVAQDSQPTYTAAVSNLVSLVFVSGKSPLADKNSLPDSSPTSPVFSGIDQTVNIPGKSLPKAA